MRRTQLYLEDDVWQALQVRARQSGLTMSELIRRAIRDAYMNSAADRKSAMAGIVGLWRNREDIGDAREYVRKLRASTRFARIK